MESFLLLAFVFLVAGVVSVPIASRLGLGSVLGYLLAGIAISPLLGLLGVDVISIQHFAEFGVVMMLFLVGLELEPRLLWEMRTRLLGLGGLQVGLTGAAVAGIAYALGQPLTISITVGMVLALSSTAIVLQTLNEKGLMKSDGGQSSFAVLLFQDIAVIPMLALLPLLAMPELADHAISYSGDAAQGPGEAAGYDSHGADDHGEGHGPDLNLVDTMAGWQRALVTLAAIGLVVVGGSYLTRPIFRFVAMARLRELFTATALLIVIGIALLMMVVGLSPALGTFLAGVVLANSEYRHELESDIDPFRGLLLGLFFITVGASINFALLFDNLAVMLGLTFGLIALKFAILFVLGIVFKVPGSNRWLMALGLAQAGEFGFVLLSFTVANNVIPQALSDQLLLVVALSMLLTPLLFILFERVIVPIHTKSQGAAQADEIDEEGPIIIAGHGRYGSIINRILLGAGHKTVVLDYSSAQLEMMRAFDFKAFFGDATRPDLLHAAGIERAKMLIVAIDDKHQALHLVRYVAQNHPHVHIVARAHGRHDVYELYQAGARDIIRETFDSACRAGRSALEALGVHPYEAHRTVKAFERRDKRAIRELAELYDPDIPVHQNKAYVARVKEIRNETDGLMQAEVNSFAPETDRGWSPPSEDDVKAEGS